MTTVKELIEKLQAIQDKEQIVLYRTYRGNIIPINDVTEETAIEDMDENIYSSAVILEKERE